MSKKIAIYCKMNLTEWDGNSLKTGIGGSETSVILLAEELAKKGHLVFVYNSVKKSRFINNVEYVPADVTDVTADLWIVWRNPETIADIKHKTGRKVLWLHDLMPEQVLMQWHNLVDTVWVQSKYHREYYPSIEDDRFSVCPSGIQYIPVSGVERDEKLLVYASDPIRGLETLLNLWPEYKMAFPKDKLVILNDWSTQEKLAARIDEKIDKEEEKTSVAEVQFLKDSYNFLVQQDGIEVLGKVSKEKLASVYEQASILAYPCNFPEVQCYTVTEAMMHGCIPVTTAQGCLQETNTGGYILPANNKATGDDFLELLIKARENVTEADRVVARDIASLYSWSNLVEKHIETILLV